MKERFKKFIALALAIVTLITVIPFGNLYVKGASDGDKESATIDTLGKLGTVNIGSKSESGTWVQTLVGDRPVFCLDLGLACHTGYVYEAKTSTLSSNSSNEANALKAKIGYWYAITKNESNKAWVYAQCLIWSIEEKHYSESELKSVINQVKTNTGYYANDSIYSDIFNITGVVTCSIVTWKYSGSSTTTQVQELMEITSAPKDYPYMGLTKNETYRQRITLQKNDEDGKGLSQVTFRFTAKNVKELYSYKFNGWGDAIEEDVDSDATKFTEDVMTDSSGKIAFKFTYKLHSQKYYYVPDQALKEMTNDEKKAMKQTLDDAGRKYAADLSKTSAEKLADSDLDTQMNDISNEYSIEEVAVANANILTSFEVLEGGDKVTSKSVNKVTIKLTKADSWTKDKNGNWPETEDGTYDNYKLAYKPILQNNYKKVSMTITKKDDETGTTAQGNATLKGAVYGLYSDAACTKLIESYTTNDKGQFETKYVRCGFNYYIKEITPPTGYLKNEQTYTVNADGAQFSAEYNKISLDVKETVKKGNVEITKLITNGDTGEVPPEVNATFQIYLTSAGSYNAAKDSEKQTITTDAKGYAKTKELPYGTYTVHQSGGDDKTEYVKDFKVQVTENGKTYTYMLNNKPYEVYLKIVKKDLRTGKTVLKAGTTYQIYSINEKGEYELVKQQYNDGHRFVSVNKFVSDESGMVITYQKLPLGKYAIREIQAADGYWNAGEEVQIEITNSSYEIEQDDEGNQIDVAVCEYVNDEAVGCFTVSKKGQILDGFDDIPRKEDEILVYSLLAPTALLQSAVVTNPFDAYYQENANDNGLEETKNVDFQYKWVNLQNVKFELYAKKDIVTQDNQGTNWFDEGSLVATITIGKGAEFTNDYDGMCEYRLNQYDGSVSIYVPLGKYELKEVQTNYGYVLPEKDTWDLSFEWQDQFTYVVDDSNKNTNDSGEVVVKNDRAKADISITKLDSRTDEPVEGAEFGFFTKDTIFNDSGEVLFDSGDMITNVITDENGYAHVDYDIPLMSELYDGENEYNSGDYYFQELGVSNSYFLSDEEIPVHVEYKDQNTPVIKAEAVAKNNQTEVEIDKYSSKTDKGKETEIKGCYLTIKDSKGKEVISWITGDADSIKIIENSKGLGYNNLRASINEKGSLVVNGLLEYEEYKLIETHPADGFVTAKVINFILEQDMEDESVTNVLIKDYDKTETKDNVNEESINEVDKADSNELEDDDIFIQEYDYLEENKLIMYDDVTSISISKLKLTGEDEIPGCSLKLTDKETGTVIDEWISTLEEHNIEGLLVVGKTYVLTETKPADGYVTASDVEFVVKDTNEIQKVEMRDDTTKVEISKTDITGKHEIKGCELQVVDKETETVVDSWISGKKPHMIECKLSAGKTYILTEKKPVKGYVTADSIEFTVNDTGDVQKVSMADDTVKVEFSKYASDTKKLLAGAKYIVLDEKGKKVYSFKTSGKKATLINQVFEVGKTYTFVEDEAPDHYKKAKDVKITIKDTGKTQKIKAVDERIPEVPNTPQTGRTWMAFLALIIGLMGLMCFSCLRINKNKEIK